MGKTWRRGDPHDTIFIVLFYIAAALILIMLLSGVWWALRQMTSPNFELRKDQWTCTEMGSESVAVPQGRYVAPHTASFGRCVQYTRRNDARGR